MKFTENDSIVRIKPDFKSGFRRVLLHANSEQDHNLDHPRLDSFSVHFPNSYVLPIAAAIGLSESQEFQFLNELTQHFGLLLPMGGDDITPILYGETPKPNGSRNTNAVRDRYEARVIRHFYFNSTRFIFAVCRGAQLTAAVLGAKLIQDNENYLNIKENHLDGALHGLELRTTSQGVFLNILKSVGSFIVNSYHHQSIDANSLKGTPLQIAAISPEGVVEAAETIDGRVVLAQFHPEKDHYKKNYSSQFFTALKDWAGLPNALSCNKIPL